MNRKVGKGTSGFVRELRVIGKRARQVWKLVPLRHKWALGGAAAVMAITSACNTALPLLLGQLVDAIKRGSDDGLQPRALYRVASYFLLGLAVTYLIREALNIVRRYLVENTCTRLDKDLTVKLVAHLMKVDLTTLSHEKVGALHGKISRSVDGFVRFLRLGFLDLAPALLTGVFALTAALTKQPWLGLVMLGVIPASVFLTIWQLLSQKGVRLKLLRSREEMDGTVVEQLSGIDYVRAAHTHHQEVKRIARAAERRRAKEIRHHFQMSLFGCAKALNEGLFHIMVLSLAIYMYVHGAISFGDILLFSGLFLNVMGPLSEVHRVLDEAHESSLRVGDLLELLGEPIDRSFDTVDGREPCVDQGAGALVEVDNLQVEYPIREGQTRRVLDGVSLAIRPGETVGVAGRSGGGKSTWLKVLMRLTHPCGGSIRIGGIPLEHVSRECIGRLIGYVSQSPFVFSGTITENIAYGNDHATSEEIRFAAERACIHDEIMAMAKGYDSPVAERGQNLSGGQRQRLALARLFLKNPPILILDEATSALDNISERKVQKAIEEARQDRTVILVAHRLSTLRNTDRIFVFDGGKIAETGNYTELLQKGGVFTDLVMSAEEVSDEAEKSTATPSKAATRVTEAAASAPTPVSAVDPKPALAPA
jgi:ATP-binding cassette subfamily B protein